MKHLLPLAPHGFAALFAGAFIGATATWAMSSTEAQFLAENDAAMAKMMAAMHVAPTGDPDADFVAMMVPHHQGAIDMAMTQLRYGRNEQLRRLAQEIIVTQQQEIAAMQLALGQKVPPAPLQPSSTQAMQEEP
jgi:uncharacterized protein (DUF305 family)